jgi:Flp pilus assembly protein TadD/4-amino-4-deoxy-L-arabinose transferase-like glycosyltransferase
VNGLTGLSRFSDKALIALLVLAAALPYLNILRNGFVSDDARQVLGNPFIRNFHSLAEIFTTRVMSYMQGGGPNYYRPLMNLTYLFCYRIFGPHPLGFHLLSLVLHALVVAAVFLLTQRLFGNRSLALAAAVLFAVHPIHCEAVAWIAAVPDLELSFFYLLTFWIFLAGARAEGRFSPLAQLAMGGSFVLTIFSKETAVTLPVLATIYEHCYRADRQETGPAQKVSRYAVLWLLTGAYLLFRFGVLGALSSGWVHHLTRYQTFVSALALLGQYFGEFFWPMKLRVLCPFHLPFSLSNGAVVLGVVASAGFCALFFYMWRRARSLSFGLLWVLITMAPVLNVRWLPGAAFEERYFYLPSVGLCWLVGCGFLKLWARASARSALRGRAVAASFCLLLGLCFLRTLIRNRDWKNNVSLYASTLAACPEAYDVRIDLGSVYWAMDNGEAAEKEWQKALEAEPRDPRLLSNLGLVQMEKQHYPEAIEFFKNALQFDPRNSAARLYLGVIYMNTHSPELAEPDLEAAVSLSPLNSNARNALGKLYMEQGRKAEAEAQFRRSVAIEATLMGYSNLGMIDWQRGDAKLAEQEWRQALRFAPNDSSLLNNLGLVTMSQGRYTEAVACFRQAAGLKPNNPLPHLNLGIAYGKLGQNGPAEAEFRAALSLNPANGEAHFQLGALYVSEGRREEGLKEYQVGLKNDPEDREALAAVQELTAQGSKK